MTPDEVQLAHDAIVTAMDEMVGLKAADWYVLNEALLMLGRNGAGSEPAKWTRDEATGLPRRV